MCIQNEVLNRTQLNILNSLDFSLTARIMNNNGLALVFFYQEMCLSI